MKPVEGSSLPKVTQLNPGPRRGGSWARLLPAEHLIRAVTGWGRSQLGAGSRAAVGVGVGGRWRQVPWASGPSPPAVRELGMEPRGIVSVRSEAETAVFQILAVTNQTLRICLPPAKCIPHPQPLSWEGTHFGLLSPFSTYVCPTVIV